MKKMLMTATVPSMIGQFNMSNIEILQELGYEVHVGCNFEDTSVWTKERIAKFIDDLNKKNIVYHQIDFARSPLGISNDVNSFKQMDKLVNENKFEFIHCHTPVAGVISRMVAHKHNLKVIYTAHGFHFYNGAPVKNWIIFYPIEKFFSRWTDVLITITQEDYKRAIDKFHAKIVNYIPGVGVDISHFCSTNFDRDAFRQNLGVNKDDLMLLSVGELNDNKNHAMVIKALERLRSKKIKYFIAGNGVLCEYLKILAKEKHVDNKIDLLGFRNDIPDLMQAADVYILPSIREGLNVSLMEAMASGLPCICGNIRGNTDLIEENKGGYLVEPTNVEAYADKIQKLNNAESRSEMSAFNRNKIANFDVSVVRNLMNNIYHSI